MDNKMDNIRYFLEVPRDLEREDLGKILDSHSFSFLIEREPTPYKECKFYAVEGPKDNALSFENEMRTLGYTLSSPEELYDY